MQMNFVIGRKREAAPSSIHQRASEAQAALDARMRGEPDPTVAKGQPWWYLLLAALFLFGVSGLAARGSIGIAILCGVAGLAALFAANKMRLKQRAAAKAKRTGAFSFAAKRPVQMPAWIIVLISVAPLGMAVQDFRESREPPFMTGTIGLLFLAAGLLGMLQQRQTRRVAGVMATAPTGTPVPPSASGTPNPGLPRLAPPARVEIIASATLQPPMALANIPTPSCNVAGFPPISILYLYNFYSQETLVTKMEDSWCRYGPVFFLGSPSDLGSGHTFALDLKKLAETELITSPAVFDARFASASRDLLPAGDAKLKGYPHFTGGWPQHGFLCTDANWRHGVERLFAAAEVVIMDASDYSLERGGLNWEIGQLINKVDATNLLVLADDTADLGALKTAFEKAWGQMRSDSPNNRPDAGPIRIVVYPGESEVRSAEQHEFAPNPPPDPTRQIAKMNIVMRQLLASSYVRACEHDRAMALLLASRG